MSKIKTFGITKGQAKAMTVRGTLTFANDDQTKKLQYKAAAKAGVSADKIVGPFNANEAPIAGRDGLYLRVSTKTGQIVWAHRSAHWAPFSTSPERATAKRLRRSKHACVWFGYAGDPVIASGSTAA